MYKEKEENIEIYFICYKKEEMRLVETYYDEVSGVHCWYFNSYLAYKYWKNNFKGLKIKKNAKKLFIIAASRYLLYIQENNLTSEGMNSDVLKKDLQKINKELEKIITNSEFANFI